MAGILRTLALAVCLATASGCMVIEEMDAAAAKMPVKDKGDAKPDPAASGAAAATAQKSAVLENAQRWWQEATSLAPAEMDSGIARCQLDGSVQFMSRDDCLSRGGRPERASG